MNKNYDAVHHPSHYTEGRKYEPKDVIRDWGLNFNLGSAVKYLSRAGRKDAILQDLRKAQQFIQFEIDAIEAQSKKEPKQVKAEPVYTETDKESGISCGVIELTMPKGADPEEIIKQVIQQIYGGK